MQMLTQMTIRDFRSFDELELLKLRQVNLIVGRNNSGKTSLLEAILAFCDPGNSTGKVSSLRQNETKMQNGMLSRWLVRDNARSRSTAGKPPTASITAVIDSITSYAAEYASINGGTLYAPSNPKGGMTTVARIACCVVTVDSKTPAELVRLYGSASVISGGEEAIEECLRQVDDRIRKIRIDPTVPNNQIVVDIGLSRLIPLSNLGQGIYRLVEILAEIIGTGSSICIIDEIENGLHHSTLRDVWKGLGAIAKKRGTQIFATTHSQECINSAAEAFADNNVEDFAIIQLFRATDKVRGRVLNEEMVEAARRGQIDLRGE